MAFGKYLNTDIILGVGIGFILSALLATSVPERPNLTNEEIIEQAKKIGMVTREEYTAVIEAGSPDKFKGQLGEQEGIEDHSRQGKPEDQAEEQPEEQPTSEVENTEEPTVEIRIPRGSGSENIARILFDAGIIKDVQEFQDLVVTKGVQRKFQRGTFIIPVNGSLEEVIDILIKRPNG